MKIYTRNGDEGETGLLYGGKQLYETNKDIPLELIEKIKKSQSFHSGLAGLRQISLGFLDMAWYTRDPKDIHDIAAFDDKALSVETYILDFDRMIYDETIRVEFLRRIRGEIKFETVSKLTEQIALDVQDAREYFAK